MAYSDVDDTCPFTNQQATLSNISTINTALSQEFTGAPHTSLVGNNSTAGVAWLLTALSVGADQDIDAAKCATFTW